MSSVLQPATSGDKRALTAADNGTTLEATADAITITVPTGLPAAFRVDVIANATTSVASSGGTLLNGATTTLDRAAADQVLFSVVALVSAADSYIVTGVDPA